MNTEIIESLKLNLYESCLQSFGVELQFIKLEFSNSRFNEIIFFIDCEIDTTDTNTKTMVTALKELDSNTFEIAYFLKANLKCIIDCKFDDTNDMFYIYFNNGYEIIFNLSTKEDANISITFREYRESKSYEGFDILAGGIIERNY